MLPLTDTQGMEQKGEEAWRWNQCVRMEKKIMNSNPQTTNFSEIKLASLWPLGSMESLGSYGLFFDCCLATPPDSSGKHHSYRLAFGEPSSPAWPEAVTITYFVSPAVTRLICIKGWSVHLAAHGATFNLRTGLENGRFCFLLLVAWVLLFKAYILSKYFTIY